jgi:putative transposase
MLYIFCFREIKAKFTSIRQITMAGYTISNQQGLHFLTFTVVGWVDVFTRKSYRDVILDSFRYCQKERGLLIYGYVIMSNHLHLIVRTEKEDLSNVIRDFKKFTAKTILKLIQDKSKGESRLEWLLNVFAYHGKYNTNNRTYQFWIQNNRPIELVSNSWIRQKLQYIHDNPVKAGWVSVPEHYLYSSASNYATGKKLLEVIVMDSIWSDVGLIN